MNLRQLLVERHLPFATLIFDIQVALLDRHPARARAAVDQLQQLLEQHARVEEELLLPMFVRYVPRPERGASPELFVAEHARLRSLITDLQRMLLPRESTLTDVEAITLLEKVHPLKNLLQHHELREETLLAPALEETVGDTLDPWLLELDAAFSATSRGAAAVPPGGDVVSP